MSISFIVPTIGRPTLFEALASIGMLPGDETIVIGPTIYRPRDANIKHLLCDNGNNWGCKERTLGIAEAKGDYLAFLDDDDVYAPEARDKMEQAIQLTPQRPVLFRMIYPDGKVLWDDPVLYCGNVSTAMILIPNRPEMLGQWTTRREGDYDFLDSMKWPEVDIVWRPEIIALMGHND